MLNDIKPKEIEALNVGDIAINNKTGQEYMIVLTTGEDYTILNTDNYVVDEEMTYSNLDMLIKVNNLVKKEEEVAVLI